MTPVGGLVLLALATGVVGITLSLLGGWVLSGLHGDRQGSKTGVEDWLENQEA